MSKRLLAVLLTCACAAVAIVPAAASAAARPTKRAHKADVLTDVAGAFAAKLALTGASYGINHLKSGALGDTGKSIGNFLGDVGLADPSPTQILGEIQGLRQEVTALSTQVNGISSQLDQLGAAVASGTYSTNVALANSLTAAVQTGSRKLQAIGRAPVDQRRALADDFVDFYSHNLKDKELTLELYLTGGAPGADGILQLASKRSASAAQPFYTHTMSEFAKDVWKHYSMVQFEWVTLTTNYLHYKKARAERITEAVTWMAESIDRSWRVIPSSTVFPNTVLDTRTMRLWTWRGDLTACRAFDEAGNWKAFNKCSYEHGKNATKAAWTGAPGYTHLIPTNGGQSWHHPTVAEAQALRTGTSGSGPQWLHDRGGFPNGITDVWSTATSATHANVVTLGNGAASVQPKTNHYQSVLVDSATYPRSWFFVS